MQTGSLTIKQAALQLGVTTVALTRRVQRGHIHAYKVGWMWLIPEESLSGVRVNRTKKVGKTAHPLYATWRAMMSRCYHTRNACYKNYGGRGIVVSDEWHDFHQFADDMGVRPPGMTLDRKDNDGPYSNDNCRWASHKTQQNNKRARNDHR